MSSRPSSKSVRHHDERRPETSMSGATPVPHGQRAGLLYHPDAFGRCLTLLLPGGRAVASRPPSNSVRHLAGRLNRSVRYPAATQGRSAGAGRARPSQRRQASRRRSRATQRGRGGGTGLSYQRFMGVFRAQTGMAIEQQDPRLPDKPSIYGETVTVPRLSRRLPARRASPRHDTPAAWRLLAARGVLAYAAS